MLQLYQQIFFTTIAVGFGIFHAILYFYNRELKSNLYFSLFLLFYALGIFFDFQASLTPYPDSLIFLRIHRAVSPFNMLLILLFSYTIFNLRISKQFWLITGALLIGGILATIEPMENFLYLQIPQVITLIEAVRIYSYALKNHKPGAWYIVSGSSLLMLFSMYDLLMDLGFYGPFFGIENGYPFGFFFLIIFTSVYLAKDYAGINTRLRIHEEEKIEAEIKHRLLQAEDERKSKELDEARTLQLSMLPNCIPEISGLDICFVMHPATEVGGDYYDYHINSEGSLTLAIGDATGHGMKAGIMVSVIKSLFITHAGNLSMIDFFNRCSQTIRQMNFKNLFMAMQLVRIEGNILTVSSAGMPPVMIYRNQTGNIEEIVTKGMPLGAVEDFAYQTANTKIQPGDILLLMSDGFPELFNDRGMMLEDFRIKDLLKEANNLRATEIVRHLITAGDQWRNGRKLHDDVSLVVIKKTI